MAHDPLCLLTEYTDPEGCPSCELNARVRADTLAKCIEAVELCTSDKGLINRENETGVEWAITALEALQEKP